MHMYDMHQELVTFYHNHVRLKEERKRLAGLRDLNLDRLNTGLDKLGEADRHAYAHPIRHRDQGGYAMHTLNTHPEDDYDLDCAIIFRAADLPASALDARKRIAAAFKKTGVRFAREPEARTNAVTVWYAEGYHIDFAVYREATNGWGETVLEHAGAQWQAANPEKMTNWFCGRVDALSPSGYGVSVEPKQMRRIVRWMKKFAKSRPTWNLPGGMILSTLVEERLSPHHQRDDIALYNTMAAIRSRLMNSTSVRNPVFPDQFLTSKPEYTRQVERLADKLDQALMELDVLFTASCTRKQALSAWHWVFKHEYWKNLLVAEENGKSSRLSIGNVANAPTVIHDTKTYG
ncbi:MAG: hypothetical protein M3R24_12845 [Chloroflexota bacterium]|nr:hypothetical protein [Chloroflexota bacterium]